MAPFQRALAPSLVITFALTPMLSTLAQTWDLDTLAPWPRWGGNERNNGQAVKSAVGGYTVDRERWVYVLPEPGDTIEAGIVVGQQNRIYVPTKRGFLICLDARTGVEIWTYNTETNQRVWTPALMSRFRSRLRRGAGTSVLPVSPCPPAWCSGAGAPCTAWRTTTWVGRWWRGCTCFRYDDVMDEWVELIVEDDRPRVVHRTDLISVAMGVDGTIYVGTRGQPGFQNSRGFVYALWGFDEDD